MALPATVREVRQKARLCADNAAGKELAATAMAEGGLWIRPNPIFAESPDAVRSALESHPERLRAGKRQILILLS